MLPSTTIVLVERLAPMLPDDFSQKLLSGSLRVVWDDNNPIRVNLFALGIREMVRHVLAMKAPDDEVRDCGWFVAAMEKKKQNATPEALKQIDVVTRRDRMVYATQGGLADDLLQGLDIDTEGMHDALVAT